MAAVSRLFPSGGSRRLTGGYRTEMVGVGMGVFVAMGVLVAVDVGVVCAVRRYLRPMDREDNVRVAICLRVAVKSVDNPSFRNSHYGLHR